MRWPGSLREASTRTRPDACPSSSMGIPRRKAWERDVCSSSSGVCRSCRTCRSRTRTRLRRYADSSMPWSGRGSDSWRPRPRRKNVLASWRPASRSADPHAAGLRGRRRNDAVHRGESALGRTSLRTPDARTAVALESHLSSHGAGPAERPRGSHDPRPPPAARQERPDRPGDDRRGRDRRRDEPHSQSRGSARPEARAGDRYGPRDADRTLGDAGALSPGARRRRTR